MKKKERQIYKKQLKTLTDFFDVRHKTYLMIAQIKFETGKIPQKYLDEWTAFVSDGQRYWRHVPGVLRKLKKTARAIAKREVKKEVEKNGQK